MPEEILDKKGIIKAIAIAVTVALAGIFVLGWYYHDIEKKRLPAIEQAIEEQKEINEERAAQETLRQFILFRISREEDIAKLYLTENAVEQAREKEFSLMGNFSSYEIISSEKISENKYSFVVKMRYKDIPTELTEIITVIKVLELEEYYIDSVQMAG